MPPSPFIKLGSIDRTAEFVERCAGARIDLPVDPDLLAAPDSPLAKRLEVDGMVAANRWVIQPMEGWDGTPDGLPTHRTLRRWHRFGESGAAMVWGGEAVAVRPDGRANPNQLMLCRADHADGIARLVDSLLDARHTALGLDRSGLVLGLQLTHSGRFCRPDDPKRLRPRILYRHPLLDRRFGLGDDHPVMADGEIRELVDAFVRAAVRARDLGFDFVDLKQCHGYLGHEFLSAVDRPGDYGGSLENRTRFLREVVQGIRAGAPGLRIAVRVSIFDSLPYRPDPDRSIPGRLGPGIPETPPSLPYRYAFGADPDSPTEIDLHEPIRLIEIYRSLGISLINLTAASPYYNPHLQRPALYPPSDGYAPPEDPLVGVSRQIVTGASLKAKFPNVTFVGSAYSYLQQFLPHVAQATVRLGWIDAVGIGRMVLSCPSMPADALAGRISDHRHVCRTLSDCTTAPRNGLVSGCYPLDPFYKESPEAAALAALKARARRAEAP